MFFCHFAVEILTTKNLFKMKNFIAKKKSPLQLPLALALLLSFQACDKTESTFLCLEEPSVTQVVTPNSVARMLSELPLTLEQVREVWDGVNASSANGFDEEYTFQDMFSCPGRGVGDERLGTRTASTYSEPLHQKIASHLASSGLQILWPYSEDWDGHSMPVITFCPEMNLETLVGFMREELPGGQWIVKEIPIDEDYAREHPVWVIGWNEDAGAVTPQMLEKELPESVSTRASSDFKTLKLKEFKAPGTQVVLNFLSSAVR